MFKNKIAQMHKEKKNTVYKLSIFDATGPRIVPKVRNLMYNLSYGR
jgi:hypothetical protein